ncbi:MAG: response regulator [Anaerolineae bacterium]|nr:response regulator [Anaerolineae bacterium]
MEFNIRTSKQKTILVIDDNSTNLSVITNILEAHDFEVLIGVDGEDGIKTAIAMQPDLILLDIIMPGIDGYEVCRRLKADAQTREIPVIFVTSMTQVNDKVQGFAVGAVDYLTKPLHEEEVLARIQTHLRIQDLSRSLRDANAVLSKRARQLEIGSQIAQQVTSLLDLDTLLAAVVKSIQEAFNYYFVGIWLLNGQHDALLLQANASSHGETQIKPDFSVALDTGRSILVRVYQTGAPYMVNDVTQSVHYLPWEVLADTRAELALPLRSNQEILGVLDIQSAFLDVFESEDVRAMQTLADQIAIAIRNARLYAIEKHLRRAEEEKAQQLAELNASKDKFFSIVAHDLRGPFQPLLSWSYLLAKKDANKDLTYVQRISDNLYRAAKDFAGLLENLLEWARVQRGGMLPTPTALNLKTVVKRSAGALAETASNKDIRTDFDIDETLYVYTDMNMLSTVIRNLLSNALKFTPNGGKVTVSARHGNSPAENIQVANSSNFVEVSVADSGVGIPPEDLEKLFRIDVHHTTTGTAQEHGTGLGLTLCKELVELNGGQIWIKSTVGQGTTVIFTVPTDHERGEG